ncbi:uncharacterized protein IL334_002562 [Kwoniella shivajii]|uniref:DNA replication regulator SLD2 n=1 Tax=Kwoniella shivajii TaxID=564305 RepID=A0ABZ1CV40_9TREE|nr:hypothetical protein IL334_002562 [Kwoniella shivajii]
MDLASVKAAVKSWEKRFRSKEGRDPTKDDIKRDSGDIASQYALYRKLTKATTSSSQPNSQRTSTSSLQRPISDSTTLYPPSSSTAGPSSSSSSSLTSQYRTTPRNIPSSDFPTTPTPPSRRANGSYLPKTRTNSQAGPSKFPATEFGDAVENGVEERRSGDNKSLKRKASRALISNSSPPPVVPVASSSSSQTVQSTSRTLFSTPKKKGYSGPIHDPNPINPFMTSPSKSPFSITLSASNQAGDSSRSKGKSFGSPFIHASSPKKLKEVLEANSLKKIKERENTLLNEITPRTRARKRLRGEAVEDTPLKDKLPRRKRGQGSGKSEQPEDNFLKPNYTRFGSGRISEDENEDEDEDEDGGDELGPSPMKPIGRGFTSLFGEVEVNAEGNEEDREEEEDDSPFLTEKNESARSNRTNGNGNIHSKKSSGKTKEPKRSKSNDIMGMFSRVGKSTLKIIPKTDPSNPKDRNNDNGDTVHKVDGNTSVIPVIQIQPSRTPLVEPTPPTDEIPIDEPIPASPTLPTDEFPDETWTRTPSRSQRREKVLSLSDDEVDEWDPEGGPVKREIKIVPTRREVKRRNSDSSDYGVTLSNHYNDDVNEGQDQNLNGRELEDEVDVDEEEEDEEADEGEVAAGEGMNHNQNQNLKMLTLLSIHSPSSFNSNSRSKSKSKAQIHQAKLDELKVKAIFNELDATKLKAFKRGQEISFTGESRENDDEANSNEDILDKYDFDLIDNAIDNENDNQFGEGLQGTNDVEDDDWESESDGWKREQIEEDW